MLATVTSFFLFITILFGLVISKYLSIFNKTLVYLLFIGVYILFMYLTYLGTKSRNKCRRYEITQDTVITFDGIISCKQRVNNMKGMIGMELLEGSIGRMFNYGTITLKFLGGAEVNIVDIDNPEIYIPKITELVNKGSTTI